MTKKENGETAHITPAGASLFLELGFDPKEARALHEFAQKELHDLLAMKEKLIAALAQWIDEKQLKQADAARILMISRPRVSDLVNRKFHLFTIDTLIGMLCRVGKTVTLSIS